MLNRIFVFLLIATLPLSANADPAATATQPSFLPLAQKTRTSSEATSKSGLHTVPPPVIAETRAVRQADGSLAVTCKEVKNPRAAAAYEQPKLPHYPNSGEQQ